MGVGSLIIFIAMILAAGIAASVLLQVTSTLQDQALKTSEETIRDVSSGLRITHISGYANETRISQLGFFIQTTAASAPLDLSTTIIAISESSSKIFMTYDSASYSATASNGLFGTLNASLLDATSFGIIVIRDVDQSCLQTAPILNEQDLVVLLINTTQSFPGGLASRTTVSGSIYSEYGIPGLISFTTPSVYTSSILDL